MHDQVNFTPDTSLGDFLVSPAGIPFLVFIPIWLGFLAWCILTKKI